MCHKVDNNKNSSCTKIKNNAKADNNKNSSRTKIKNNANIIFGNIQGYDASTSRVEKRNQLSLLAADEQPILIALNETHRGENVGLPRIKGYKSLGSGRRKKGGARQPAVWECTLETT